MTEQLKPLLCPFCGHIGLQFESGSTYRWGIASCAGCGATCGEVRRNYPDDGKWHAEAVEAWNRRAQPAQAVPQYICPNGDKCKHGSWCSEVYCQELCQFRKPAQAVPVLSASQILDMMPESISARHDGALLEFARAIEQAVRAVRAKMGTGWIATDDQMPPPDAWVLVAWGDGAVDKAHTFTKWKHPTNPLGYLIQGHPGSHNDVTHWMPLPPPPGIVGKEGA